MQKTDNLFVVVKKDVMCFNTLDNDLHHFSASLTFNALCYNRESACVTALSAYVVFRHFQSVSTFVAAVICHLSKTRRLSFCLYYAQKQRWIHTQKNTSLSNLIFLCCSFMQSIYQENIRRNILKISLLLLTTLINIHLIYFSCVSLTISIEQKYTTLHYTIKSLITFCNYY